MAVDLFIKNIAICWFNLRTISKLKDQNSFRCQLTRLHSKIFGHFAEIIWKSKVEVHLTRLESMLIHLNWIRNLLKKLEKKYLLFSLLPGSNDYSSLYHHNQYQYSQTQPLQETASSSKSSHYLDHYNSQRWIWTLTSENELATISIYLFRLNFMKIKQCSANTLLFHAVNWYS